MTSEDRIREIEAERDAFGLAAANQIRSVENALKKEREVSALLREMTEKLRIRLDLIIDASAGCEAYNEEEESCGACDYCVNEKLCDEAFALVRAARPWCPERGWENNG